MPKQTPIPRWALAILPRGRRTSGIPGIAVRHMLAVLALVLGLVAGAFPGPVPAAPAIEAGEAKRKINLAGRQRMLSQRMAMLACMADAGVQRESALERAAAARQLFEDTLRGLREGDAEQGLPAEQEAAVLAAITEVERLWTGYEAAVSGYLADGAAEALRAIHARNGAVLKTMNAAVGLMERRYGEGLIARDLATALNIAGRQRMLIMKALKEACMVGRGLDPAGDRQALRGTVALFSTSLYKLRTGNAWDGIIPPPSFEVDMQLELVQAVWDWMEPHLKAIAGGATPDQARMSELLYHGEVALREMNTAVWLYENS